MAAVANITVAVEMGVRRRVAVGADRGTVAMHAQRRRVAMQPDLSSCFALLKGSD